ncbi:hypothetical protein AB0D65_27145, partial [Streptomyces griseoloalbus]
MGGGQGDPDARVPGVGTGRRAAAGRRPLHRTGSVDWSERHFQLRVENTWEHNAAEIA